MSKPRGSFCHWLGGLTISTMLVTPHLVAAQQPVGGSGDWYYQMGGAIPVSPAPNVNSIAIDLVGSAGLQLPRACGSLDPTIAISNTLGNVADGLDNLDGLLVAAATNAIAALPAIILQRANPGLYDHFQSAVQSAKQTYELSVKSCQQIVEDAINGESPFSGWIKTSQRDAWLAGLQDPDADSVAVEEIVDSDGGDNGVLWLGGERKGGFDQPPLPIIQDTVTAGYNLILGREVTAVGAPGVLEARLIDLFASPEDASGFARDVLGDLIVQTCQGCTPETVAPTGALLQSSDVQALEIQEAFAALVAADQAPSEDDLDAISSSTTLITSKLIDDLREIEEDQDRALYVNRLSAGVAVQITVERGLALRRMILAGRQVPEIYNNLKATDFIDKKLDELEVLIRSLKFELDMQLGTVGNIASIVTTEAERIRKISSDDPRGVERGSEDLFLQGRVRPE